MWARTDAGSPRSTASSAANTRAVARLKGWPTSVASARAAPAAGGRVRVAQEPQRVPEPAGAHHLQVDAEPEQVGPVLGRPAVDTAASKCRRAAPNSPFQKEAMPSTYSPSTRRRSPASIPPAWPLAEPLGALEVPRTRLTTPIDSSCGASGSTRARRPAPAPAQQPGQPVRRTPRPRRGGAWKPSRPSSRSRRARVGAGPGPARGARSSSRTASALAPSRWATAAPRARRRRSPPRRRRRGRGGPPPARPPRPGRRRAAAPGRGPPAGGCGGAGRAEGGVGDLADAVVGEVVGVGAPVADDPPPPQLVQAADQGFLVGLAGLGEHVGGELAADGGGHADQVAGRRGQLGQPGLDHPPEPLG